MVKLIKLQAEQFEYDGTLVNYEIYASEDFDNLSRQSKIA